jgi:hypothetical protein
MELASLDHRVVEHLRTAGAAPSNHRAPPGSGGWCQAALA